ncbi:hypothetical protein Pcinc_025491 [Petrolisthes cinctipes]|uniref:Cation/H+ exchanger transmembrane domain-containing protein n=1 Tax=Petrolisthes cinctipes TaxID=88211 RepID=A0AAE1F8F1_PETCI|nr:hypothetical protein Pcinc_025491 [Petrolisthes cinctipes]
MYCSHLQRKRGSWYLGLMETVNSEKQILDPPSLQTEDGSDLVNVELNTLVKDSEAVHQSAKQKGCVAWCCSFLLPLSKNHNPLPPQPTLPQRLKYALLCPPHGRVGEVLVGVVLLGLVYGFFVAIMGDTARPGGNIFSLMVLFVVALVAGAAVTPLKLPPLLGMLVAGILLKSVPGLDYIGKNIDQEWSAILRNMALVVVLVRAGLGLDPAALKQLSLVVVRLAFCPCLVETVVVAIMTHLLLGFPWLWGLMLGFVLGAVTPAVIVPCMLVLARDAYGVDKGIPTLVIAASSVDDVLAISGFGILMGITFAEGELWMVILKGPFEVVVGLLYGAVVGALCWVLPESSHNAADVLRLAMVFFAGLFSLFGSQIVKLGGAGALGCLVVAFVAGYGWRKQGSVQHQAYVDDKLEILWQFFQPFLFALIGAEIQVDSLEGSTVWYGLATLAVGLVFRLITSYLVVMGANLNVKERIFVALAWLPKATVQAAIGAQALDYAKKTNAGPEEEKLGQQVLTIAVLVILITAPVGAAAIMLSAPRLLSKPDNTTKESLQDIEKDTEITHQQDLLYNISTHHRTFNITSAIISRTFNITSAIISRTFKIKSALISRTFKPHK